MYRFILFFLIINVSSAFGGINYYSVFGPNNLPFAYGFSCDTIVVTKETKINSDLIFYVEKINGLGRKYFLGHKLIVPRDTFIAKQFCPVEKIRLDYLGIDSMIFVDKIKNLFTVYKKGLLIYWGPITRGRKFTYTPSGNFIVRGKAKRLVSTKYGNTPMPFSLVIQNNVCMHEGAMVGRPDSHGCIRLLREDAIWMYNWAKVGVKITIA